MIRFSIWNEAKQKRNEGASNFIEQAIKKVAERTGYAESYLKDIYYRA